jgi:hypothetical protein
LTGTSRSVSSEIAHERYFLEIRIGDSAAFARRDLSPVELDQQVLARAERCSRISISWC